MNNDELEHQRLLALERRRDRLKRELNKIEKKIAKIKGVGNIG